MEPNFSGSKAKISYKRTIPNILAITSSWKVTVECGVCSEVYKTKIKEFEKGKYKKGEINCPQCKSSIKYKFEIP